MPQQKDEQTFNLIHNHVIIKGHFSNQIQFLYYYNFVSNIYVLSYLNQNSILTCTIIFF